MKFSGIFLAYSFAVINALIVGFSFLFTKNAMSESSPLDTLAHRFSVAFIVIVFLALLRIIKVDLTFSRFKRLLPLTVFYPALFFSFQAFGLKYSQSSDAGIIFAMTPIITTMFAAFFLREQTTIMQKLSITLSVCGVIFIFFMKGSSLDPKSSFGIVLLLISCMSIAGYSVMTRSLTKSFSPQEISFFMLGVGFLFFNGAAVSNHLSSGDIVEFLAPWSSMRFIVAILFLGILASLVTSMLSNFVLSKIKASQMSVFSNLSTVVSIAAGAIFLGEVVTSFDIIGSVLILVGVVGTNYFEAKREEEEVLVWEESPRSIKSP